MLHGAFPKELGRFLKSGAVGWFPRLCAFLLWTTTAEQGPGRRSSSSSGSRGISLSSPFAAYSKLLPDPERDLGLLLNFDEREAGLLLPRELAAVAARERESLRRAVHDRWFGGSTSSSSSEFSLASLGLTPRGFESTLAAAALVNSRCFAEEAPVGGEGEGRDSSVGSGSGGRQRQALSLVVPLCDFANHASAPSAAFRLSTEEEGAFELVATRALSPGEEVTISYLGGAGNASSFSAAVRSSSSNSAKDSTGMLRAYGFVFPGNPADRLASLAEAGRALEEARKEGSSSSSASAAALLPAAAAALASRSRDPAERRRIAAAAASIAEGAAGGASFHSSSSSSSSSREGLTLLASRVEAEAEEAREAADRDVSLASNGQVSLARAEAASSWWLERAELARCGAELLRELGK